METLLTKAIQDSIINYANTSIDGARSTKKLKALHGQIASDISAHGLYTMSQGYGYDREYSVPGFLKHKNGDITIFKDKTSVDENHVLGIVEFKIFMASIGKNFTNYIENMIGDCCNIQANGIPEYNMIIIPDISPIYDKNKNITKIEHNINDNHINPYRKMMTFMDGQYCKPAGLCIIPANIWIYSANGIILNPQVSILDIDAMPLSDENMEFMKSVNDYHQFITHICDTLTTWK